MEKEYQIRRRRGNQDLNPHQFKENLGDRVSNKNGIGHLGFENLRTETYLELMSCALNRSAMLAIDYLEDKMKVIFVLIGKERIFQISDFKENSFLFGKLMFKNDFWYTINNLIAKLGHNCKTYRPSVFLRQAQVNISGTVDMHITAVA